MKYNAKYLLKKISRPSLRDYLRYAKMGRSKIEYIFCSLLKGYASIPPNFYIYVNNRCNYRCLMCDFKTRKGGYFRDSSGEEMALADWQKFIDSIYIYNPAIFFPAPEPFLYKDIMSLLSHIKSRGLFCSIATNASLLNKFAQELVNIGIDTLELSCDGPPEVHDRIRGVSGAFSNFAETIIKIQKIKGKSESPRLNLAFTITHLNYSRINETLDILDGLGVKMNLTISHLTYMPAELIAEHNRKNDFIKINTHTQGYADICKNIDTEMLSKHLKSAKERKFKNIKNLFISPDLDSKALYNWYNSPLDFNIDLNCFFPWLVAHINFNGNLIMSPICGPVFGNITQQSFVSLWNSRKFREIRAKIFKDKKYAPCFGCCGLRAFF